MNGWFDRLTMSGLLSYYERMLLLSGHCYRHKRISGFALVTAISVSIVKTAPH